MPNKYHGATHEEFPIKTKPLSEKSEFRDFQAGNQNAHVETITHSHCIHTGGIERNQRGFQQAALRTWKLIRK